MTTLLLIRHGETDWNVEGRYQGQADPPLNETGLHQARQTALELQNLGPHALYSSDLRRARQTAQAIAEITGLTIQLEPRLREVNLGEWEGILYTEIKARYPELLRRWEEEPLKTIPPGGESIWALRHRVLDAIAEILARHTGQQVCIVSHKTPIAIIKCHYLDIPLEHIWNLLPPNAAWERLELTHPYCPPQNPLPRPGS